MKKSSSNIEFFFGKTQNTMINLFIWWFAISAIVNKWRVDSWRRSVRFKATLGSLLKILLQKVRNWFKYKKLKKKEDRRIFRTKAEVVAFGLRGCRCSLMASRPPSEPLRHSEGPCNYDVANLKNKKPWF